MRGARIGWVALLLTALAGCTTPGSGSAAASGAATPSPAAATPSAAALTESAAAPAMEGPPQKPSGGGGTDTPPGYVTVTGPSGVDNNHGGVELGDDGSDCANVSYLSDVPIPDGVTLTPTDATISDDPVGNLSATEYFTIGGAGCTRNPVCSGGSFHWSSGSATAACGIPIRQIKGWSDSDDVSVLLTLHARVDCPAGQAVCDAYKSQIGNAGPVAVGLVSQLPSPSDSATPSPTATN